ncbi:serine hydrolase [Paracoccus pacificus]|uniref:Serine hydrolase n=1 Tax=Paracoccus pacificus TaxID=1463598 RepID=A0ABW4RAZ2_9RHOB
MDARTGREIYSSNADARLHPASLTKMMTLYIAFQDIERGRVRLDSRFTVTQRAANEPPSKLGLRPGQKIELRYLIRAAAVKSANDAATLIGEGLGGSEAAFAQRMNATARALGMRNTHFMNANGLTREGHYSSARDLSILGRHLFYDFPQYYSIFSRRSADAGVAQVRSTNARFLDAYEGADGIKTGYTRAAGFNLTASAQRGNKRIIATVLGGKSTAHRNEIMAQLLDAGFGKAPAKVREIRPQPPKIAEQPKVRRTIQVARAELPPPPATPVATLASLSAPTHTTIAPKTAARPERRADQGQPAPAAPEKVAAAPAPAAAPDGPGSAGLAQSARPVARPGSSPAPTQVAAVAPAVAEAVAEEDPPEAEGDAAPSTAGIARSDRPVAAPNRDRADAAPQQAATSAPVNIAAASTAGTGPVFIQTAAPQPESLALAASPAPEGRSETVILASLEEEGDRSEPPEAVETVRRNSNDRGNWGISIGRYRSQAEAEQLLMKTALSESDTLGVARSGVANTNRGFEPRFTGLSQASAELACQRLEARQLNCTLLRP